MTITLICKNPNTKFSILKIGVPIQFVFEKDSECCIFPVNASLYELLNNGWYFYDK